MEELEESPTRMPDRLPTLIEEMRGWRFCMILLVVPLLLIVAVDVLVCRVAKKSTAGNTADEAQEPAAENANDNR